MIKEFAVKKITLGTPESLTPSRFCPTFRYEESSVSYPVDNIMFTQTARGFLIRMPLTKGEHIYGLGLQLKAFDLVGRKMTIRPNADPMAATGDSHAPVPFFVSSKGYGVYLDTARYAEFYFGSSRPLKARMTESKAKDIAVSTEALYSKNDTADAMIEILIPATKGVDLYIMEGHTVGEVVAKYNKLAGGGCHTPAWGLSAIYRCYSRYSQDKVLEIAKSFREKELAIGTIGLEPGWQSRAYSCSYVWNDSLYPSPKDLIDSLKEMGFHVNLWEHAFVHPSSPIYEKLIPYSGDHEVWSGCVPDFSIDEAKTIFADHTKNLVAMGIDSFKLDECDSSDYTGGWSFPNHTAFPSGLDGEQYHSLFGTLYMQAILEALGETPTLSEVRNAGALAAPYPFVLYSDLYDHRDFIRGNATAGFSGLLWTPEVRDTLSGTREEFIRRLQSNVFSVQCLINAWYCEEAPWLAFDCEDEVKYWLSVRESLVPRLQAAFDRYQKEGVPPVRALVFDYTDDAETHRIDDEYLLGDDLLVAPIVAGSDEREVYLPVGEWVDFFTGEKVACGKFTVKTESIPVYRRVK